MKYRSRLVRSKPGLSQEDALASLQNHPGFKSGTKIASLKKQGSRWVARLLEPTVKKSDFEEELESEEPKDVPSEDGDDDSDDDDLESDFPPPPKDKGDDETDDKKGGDLKEVLSLLKDIAGALGIHKGEEDKLDDLGPELDGPPGPPLGGPPPPKEEAPKKPTKLGPGESLPSVTPVGAPAFSSVQQGIESRNLPSFIAETTENLSVKAAKTQLEKAFPGYRVAQMKRQPDALRALIVRSR